MDTNNNANEKQIVAKPIVAKETKKCKCCGNVLPLDSFYKRGLGYRSICIACIKTANGVSDKFAKFTSRELIDELTARGYRGELKKTVTETIRL